MKCKDADNITYFVCKTCGCELEVWQTQEYCSFTKIELQIAQEADDFEVMFKPAYTTIKVHCTNCNNPKLTDEDA